MMKGYIVFRAISPVFVVFGSNFVQAVAGGIGIGSSCRFSVDYQCSSFQSGGDKAIEEYLHRVVSWEKNFAQSGIGYDPSSGYTYDGHPIDYSTGNLYGDPHLFSAPSKESIHLAILSLALEGNSLALEFAGGLENAIETLELKMNGYSKFNATYPGYGCFTPWIGFDSSDGSIHPLEDWSKPYYKVPGLDNGEWFWSLYATAFALERKSLSSSHSARLSDLAMRYRAYVDCQKASAKAIFYRGDGDVSATVYILDPFIPPVPENYVHCEGYLNDPYEGETMTMLLYLFADWGEGEKDNEREMMWLKKRELLQAVNYTLPEEKGVLTVQKGYWFSTHEQWKTLLLPYLAEELPVVRKIFSNCEIARTWDAHSSTIPGLFASVNDVTDGSQEIPDYASACGIPGEVSFQSIERRDIITPYASFGLFLHNRTVAACWYNNMLRGPRMQSFYGSTEAININGTEISPILTWDSKITTVLAMMGGIGELVKRALQSETDLYRADSAIHGASFPNAYARFVYVVGREYSRVFLTVDHPDMLEAVKGDGDRGIEFAYPITAIPDDELSDWELSCSGS